jgi:hypothetical protein
VARLKPRWVRHPSFQPRFTLIRTGAEIRIVYLLTSGVVKVLARLHGEDVLVSSRTANRLLEVAPAIRGDR